MFIVWDWEGCIMFFVNYGIEVFFLVFFDVVVNLFGLIVDLIVFLFFDGF